MKAAAHISPSDSGGSLFIGGTEMIVLRILATLFILITFSSFVVETILLFVAVTMNVFGYSEPAWFGPIAIKACKILLVSMIPTAIFTVLCIALEE